MRKLIFVSIIFILSYMLAFTQNNYKVVKYFNSIENCTDNDAYMEDIDCVYLRVYYPIFTESDNNSFNDLVLSFVYKSFFNKPYNNFDKYAKEFFNEYKKFQSDYNDLKWWHNISIDTVICSEKIIAISFSSYFYAGGAHGANKIVTMNYNKTDSRLIDLNDIFIDNYEEAFNNVLNRIVKLQVENDNGIKYEKKIDFFNYENYAYDNLFNRVILGTNKILIHLDYYDECYRMGANYLLEVPYASVKNLLQPEYRYLAK